MQYLYFSVLFVLSYLFGNISWARIISKLSHGDVTKSGSGNPGTLNMWRAFGFWKGILTFVLDFVKGVLPCIIALFLFKHLGYNHEIAIYIAGFAVVLGHIFPVCYKFKGGKGIATSLGVFIVANWWVTLIVFLVMILLMLFIKYGSVLTLGAILALSIVEIVLTNPANWLNYILICAILTIVFFAHRKNIYRLIKGKENPTELLRMFIAIFKGKKKDD